MYCMFKNILIKAISSRSMNNCLNSSLIHFHFNFFQFFHLPIISQMCSTGFRIPASFRHRDKILAKFGQVSCICDSFIASPSTMTNSVQTSLIVPPPYHYRSSIECRKNYLGKHVDLLRYIL